MNELSKKVFIISLVSILATGSFFLPLPQTVYAVTCGLGTDNGSGTCVDFVTSGTSVTIPSDWNSSSNTIECIGAGGNGANSVASNNSGSGGGGGSYAKITNQPLSSGSVSIQVATGGSGNNTYLQNNSSVTVLDCGAGGNASGTTAGSAGTVVNGTGYSGGTGGAGTTGAEGSGAGGGGSAGPVGIGKNGANGAGSTGTGGGGGGGSDGSSSTNGNTNSSSTGGNGGNGTSGSGSGSGGTKNGNNCTAGTIGGGGGGGGEGTGSGIVPGCDGGSENLWSTGVGPSGGGGGGGGAGGTAATGSKNGGNGGTYGGGGGGAGYSGAHTFTGGTGGQGLIVISYVPASAVTTLGNGTDGGNSTIGPGASATEIDRFSLSTDSGTDTVTGMTVTLGPTNAYQNIGTVSVETTGGTTLCSATPSSNIVTLTSCGISVTTSSTEYKVMITPLSATAMPAPPGASYATTATVTSITAGNSTAGSDSGSATITVDNLSPGDVTSATATAGNAQVSLSWTNPGDTDLSAVMVLASTSAITYVPTEGNTYSTCTLNGASRVACYGLQTSCTDTSLANGTPYYYKIYTVDTNGNYSTPGVTPSGSPVTPAPPAVALTHFRWRTDNGTEVSATYPLAQDVSATQYLFLGDRVRLRFLVSNTGSPATGYTYTLEQSSSTCTSWIPVPSYTITSMAGNTHWIMDLSGNVADGTPTTDHSALTDPGGGSFVAGYVESLDNPPPALTLGPNQFTELEYSIRSTGFATIGTNYCFRLTNNGDTTNFTYSTRATSYTDQYYLPSVWRRSKYRRRRQWFGTDYWGWWCQRCCGKSGR